MASAHDEQLPKWEDERWRGCPMGHASGNQGSAAAAEGAEPLHYNTYLQLDKLLGSQQLISAKDGAIHDEHLFIIVHQAFELWFKQCIFEIDSIRDIFAGINELKKRLEGKNAFLVAERLDRVIKILDLIRGHFGILETMTPMGFLEFRGYLSPASGFQSLQFRLLENKFGVQGKARERYANKSYEEQFVTSEDKDKLKESKERPTLFALVERWLENLLEEHDDFPDNFQASVKKLLEDNPGGYTSLPSAEEYEKKRRTSMDNGECVLSHRALLAAMMVYLYREHAAFQQHFRILIQLLEADAQIAKWRYHHVLMVQRMIGSKVGTGGSSGYLYLRATVSDKYRVFVGLTNLSTFIIPSKYLLPLRGASGHTGPSEAAAMPDVGALKLADP